MTKEKFPETFKITGTEDEFLYLLEERKSNNIKTHILMKAKHDGIEVVQDLPTPKGVTLPVYLPLCKTMFFIGTMEMA